MPQHVMGLSQQQQEELGEEAAAERPSPAVLLAADGPLPLIHSGQRRLLPALDIQRLQRSLKLAVPCSVGVQPAQRVA